MNRAWSLGVVLALAGWLVPSTSVACSCTWGGPFLKVAPHTELIVRAKVVNYHGESRGVRLAMDVEVSEVFKGRAPAKTIRIWGDNGALCRPYVSKFPVQTEWIFAVNPLAGRPGEYFISVCGENWLKAQHGQVSGHISSFSLSGEKQIMSLEELRAALKAS